MTKPGFVFFMLGSLNFLVALFLALLFFNKYLKDRHPASIGWSVSAFLGSLVNLSAAMASKYPAYVNTDKYIFLLLNGYLGVMIFCSTLLIIKEKITGFYFLIFSLLGVAISIWAYAAVTFIDNAAIRVMPTMVLVGLALLVSAYLLKSIDLSRKSKKIKLGIITLAVSFAISGVISLVFPFVVNSEKLMTINGVALCAANVGVVTGLVMVIV